MTSITSVRAKVTRVDELPLDTQLVLYREAANKWERAYKNRSKAIQKENHNLILNLNDLEEQILRNPRNAVLMLRSLKDDPFTRGE